MGKEIPWSFQKIRSGEQLNLKGRGLTNVASLTAAGITPAKNPDSVTQPIADGKWQIANEGGPMPAGLTSGAPWVVALHHSDN